MACFTADIEAQMEPWRDKTMQVQNHLLKVNDLNKVFAIIKLIWKFTIRN